MTLTFVAIVAVLAAIILYGLRDKLRGKQIPTAIRPGQKLPEFSAQDEGGNAVSSSDLLGQPAVLLFVRGSWCPFCSKQVADLTKHYKEITESGARLVLVTPQPLETTRRVADFYKVDFDFWLDESLQVAKMLGLVQSAGVPKDYRAEYGDDTVWPTSLVIDKDGVIRLTEMSRFIADRPDAQKLLDAVRKAS